MTSYAKLRPLIEEFKPPFRGSITDYARTISLGSGYIGVPDENVCRTCRDKGIYSCRHFEIDTARQLVGPFQAIEDENVRVVMILKAAQTLGSFTWDMSVHYLIVHSRYKRIKVLIDSDEKARRYCDERLMDTLKNNPDIAPMLPTGARRFDDAKTEIRFTNGKTLTVCGLNESNASSLPSDVIVIDEGWLHQSDGLMKKAVDRTKQIKHRKVIIVGQAGDVKEDQDIIWTSLDKRVPLTFACPCCDGRQEFELNKVRPESFTPRPRTHWMGEYEAPKAGTYFGFKTPHKFSDLTTPEQVKAAADATVVECLYCGYEILDTKENRSNLMASYEQNYQETAPDGTRFTPPDYRVGFWNPDPSSVTVPFAQTMYEYILAVKANEEFGNIMPLRDFYKGRWATPWDKNISSKTEARITASIYDGKEQLPGEKVRISATDIQHNLTHMIYQAWAIGDGTPPRLLHYEWVKPPAMDTDEQKRNFCKARVRELDKEFGIEVQNSMKDAGHRPDLVREWAAEDAVIIEQVVGWAKKKKVYTYGLLIGDDRLSYLWKNPGRKNSWERFKQERTMVNQDILRDGKRLVIPVYTRSWSNPSIKDIAVRWRDGDGAPRILVHEKFLSDTTPEGFWAQLNSERKTPWRGRPGKERYDNEGRPNHAWDGFCMVVERMDELYLLNSFGAPEEEKEI